MNIYFLKILYTKKYTPCTKFVNPDKNHPE